MKIDEIELLGWKYVSKNPYNYLFEITDIFYDIEDGRWRVMGLKLTVGRRDNWCKIEGYIASACEWETFFNGVIETKEDLEVIMFKYLKIQLHEINN